MGCDIHLHAEVRQAGVWAEIECPPDDIDDDTGGGWYTHRNYFVFSCLADVRNDEHITPIDSPRGLPPDVSPTVYADSEEWGIDGHSHSWLTIDELSAWTWPEDDSPCDTAASVFMAQMEKVRSAAWPAPARIVFWFDN